MGKFSPPLLYTRLPGVTHCNMGGGVWLKWRGFNVACSQALGFHPQVNDRQLKMQQPVQLVHENFMILLILDVMGYTVLKTYA